MKIKIAFIGILSVALVACYKIDRRDYLSIVFNDSKLKPSYLKKYIDDVVNRDSVQDSIIYMFSGVDTLRDDERVIYFKENPKEYYLLCFDASPCWIQYIYNERLSKDIIANRDSIDISEIKRIERRFRKEILDKAEEYGRQNNIPDTLMYNSF